ncbi:MAG TPA: hypothetical protein VGN83_17140 [Falsiroseomonas sp.]|nr:hypothetical protein [Falsiroseomonas sp.]
MRQVVLATGMDGRGAWGVPEIVARNLPRHRYAHTADDIDFAALAGKRVVVVGAGAGAALDAVGMDADGIRLETPQGLARADFLILGTGLVVDLARRPELAALWRDRFVPPPGEEHATLGFFPYYSPELAFTPREASGAWSGACAASPSARCRAPSPRPASPCGGRRWSASRAGSCATCSWNRRRPTMTACLPMKSGNSSRSASPRTIEDTP